MSEGGYKIRDKEGIHFVSFAVVEWIDVFTRKEYRDFFYSQPSLSAKPLCATARGLGVIYQHSFLSGQHHPTDLR